MKLLFVSFVSTLMLIASFATGSAMPLGAAAMTGAGKVADRNGVIEVQRRGGGGGGSSGRSFRGGGGSPSAGMRSSRSTRLWPRASRGGRSAQGGTIRSPSYSRQQAYPRSSANTRTRATPQRRRIPQASAGTRDDLAARRAAAARRSRGDDVGRRQARRDPRAGTREEARRPRGTAHYRQGRWHRGDPRWRGKRRYHRGRYWRPAYDGWYYWSDNAWWWAPAFGVAVIASYPVWGTTTVLTYEPWTDEWFDYCIDRYRSFDPATGYWVGYDGRRRFCVYRG